MASSVLFFITIITCLLISSTNPLLTYASHSVPSSVPALSIPPPGNSLGMKTNTRNGFVHYGCLNNKWEIVSMSADLQVFDTDNAHVVGNYSYVKNSTESTYRSSWTILNSEGDRAESGSEYSVVIGDRIAVPKSKKIHDLPSFLAIATKHMNEGAMSRVSYIAMVNTQGGVLVQDQSQCEDHNTTTIDLAFSAEFHFWKQDLVPPSMPNTLIPESQRAVQGFYGSGVVVYIYDGEKWNEKEAFAKMYDVPGGKEMGSYFTTSTPDKNGSTHCWQMNNPNGFALLGKLACKPELVSPICLPWTLSLITTSIGNLSVFGPYTFIQTVSTRGGLPPTSFKEEPHRGQTWNSSFSAIYWFYSKM